MGEGEKMKLIEEDIKKFLSDGAFAETTQRYYGCVLRTFAKWLGDRDFDEDTVREYGRERYPNPKSKNTFTDSARSFAKWKQNKIPPVGDENMIRRHELEQVRRIKHERVVTEVLEEISIPMDKMREIFSLLRGNKVRFATLWCLAWFGCRPGELIMLEPRAVNYEKGEVIFDTEKTKVKRKLYFDEFTGEQLERFLGAKRRYPFILQVCAELRRRVGMHLVPKSFRRTFITEMQGSLARAGFRPVRLDILVKLMAGHTVGDITRAYTDAARDMREAMLDHHYILSLEGTLSGAYTKREALPMLEYVRDNPGVAVEKTAQDFGMSRGTAAAKLSQLQGLGLLRREVRTQGRGRPRYEHYINREGVERLQERS